MFGAHTKRRPLAIGDRVLALLDPGKAAVRREGKPKSPYRTPHCCTYFSVIKFLLLLSQPYKC